MMVPWLLHAISGFAMLIVIIMVQGLIYPQFLKVGKQELSNYALSHQRRISYIVGPLMIIEALSLVWLWAVPNGTYPMNANAFLIIMSICLALIWGLTAYKIVPLHANIEKNGHDQDIKQLIYLNTYRSVLWLIKNVGMLILLYQVYKND